MAIENKKTKNKGIKRNKWIIFVICLVTLIIVLVNIFSILVVCVPSLFEKIIPDLDLSKHLSTMTKKDQIEASILSSCVSIIALAVAIWTGINITNAIERKDFYAIQEGMADMEKNQESIAMRLGDQEERMKQQNNADKEKVLNELYKTYNDESTKALIRIIKEYSAEPNISFLAILEVERLFRNVYFLHDNGIHIELLDYADEGILRAGDLLEITDNDNLKLYLKYRIAEFSFYSGYCYKGDERADKFLRAIELYKEVAMGLGANLPVYKKIEYPFTNYTYEGCSNSQVAISAYFCNTIGEAYSKITQEKNNLIKYRDKTKIEEYGLSAVFYCAYAVHWNAREVYLRNLGCALERHYECSDIWYGKIAAVYERAMNQPDSNKNTFKALLSIYDKRINDILEIDRVNPNEKRIPPLSDSFYEKTWRLCQKRGEVKDTLKVLGKRAEQAKKIYPSNDVGYTYSCIYHRDVCTLSRDKDFAKKHLDLAHQNLEILQIISPNAALTKILKSDLEDLDAKIGI